MILIALTAAALAAEPPAPPIRLARGNSAAVEIGGSDVQEAILPLRAGESAEVSVLQSGVDVVVELFGPSGALLDSVDSPNGRQGPEPVALIARETGAYRLRIRPIAPNEPRGHITVDVAMLRSVAETRRLIAERRRARDAAAGWLARQNAPLPAAGMLGTADPLPPFDSLAAAANVIGLGEATHGSRELNDFRLSLVQRLVVRHGYRLIGLEDSASRWRALEEFAAGRTATPDAALEWGWIGRRTRRALLDWVRQWNVEHPADRVRIVGLDAQDNEADREGLGSFLGRAYGEAGAATWAAQAEEIAAADAQSAVFGDSGTSAALRQSIKEIVAQLAMDAPLLRARFGDAEYGLAFEAALNLSAFVDFNAGSGALSHSRDWYMAAALIRAMGEGPPRPKAIYWGHNAHVSAAATRWGPTGALLRQTFGCGYRAVATTFGGGDTVVQIPGDPQDRLVSARLAAPSPDEERVETVLASIRPGAHLSAWRCGDQGELPAWLAAARPMRWVGALYLPDSAPSASYQPYALTAAFDAVAYFPTVGAEAVPVDRPVVPPRRRP